MDVHAFGKTLAVMASIPIKILFIGNSYTNRNDLPGLLTQLAASGNKSLETDRVIANGMGLRFHWNKGEAAEALNRERWDYVVLQEQSNLPWKSPLKMHEAARLFDEAIKNHGAKTVFYMTWARQDAPERQNQIREAYQQIGEELRAIVVPVGSAWEHTLKEHPGIALHDPDKSHPSLAGSYLAACVFYATLFKEDTAPLEVQVSGLDEAERKTLQRIADETARQSVQASPQL
jgi:hypothetical protein